MTIKRNDFAGINAYKYFNGTLIGSAVVGGGYESIEGGTHDLSGLGQRDVGGPCRLRREWTKLGTATVPYQFSSRGSTLYPTGYGFLQSADLTDTDIKANGTTGIARTTPTNPVFSAGTALGELHADGIPSAVGLSTWRARTKQHLGLSGEYLNYEFGWLPLVGDIRNFAYAVKNHRDILRDFKAGSGKNTRVSYNFTSSTRSEGYTRAVGLRMYDGTNGGTPLGTVTSREEVRARFSGCFTYHLPVGDTAYSKAMQYGAYADKLLGVRLTPEVLWNLTPWSWGIDWFSNTGDIIHNFSTMGHDGLVLKYGYSMFRRYYSSSVRALYSATGQMCTLDVRSDSYIRLPSSPYFGFGTTGSLSATQSAILIALGLNHMR